MAKRLTAEQQRLAVKHIGIVNAVVQKLRHTYQLIEFEDLMSWGNEGLVLGLLNYQPDRKVKLTSYLFSRVKWNIQTQVRRQAMHPYLEMVKATANRHWRSLEQRLGRQATYQDKKAYVSALKGVHRTEKAHLKSHLLELKQGLRGVQIGVSEEVHQATDDDEAATSVLEGVNCQTAEQRMIDVERNALLRKRVNRAIDLLPDRQRLVVKQTFFKGKSSRQIAPQLGITRNGIDYHRKSAIKLLRRSLSPAVREVGDDLTISNPTSMFRH